jgi:hypothetical protein
MRLFVQVCLSLSLGLAIFAAACGGDDGGNGGDDDEGDDVADGGDGDADGGGDSDGGGDGDGDADGGQDAECVPGTTECTDCVDNDGDTLVDGADPHCTGPLDEQESSFSTGIAGDNVDAKKQECFFDGNSGQCQVHTCCLLDGECPESLGTYNPPQSCSNQDAECLQSCLPLTPVGCDCYGCCTVCNPATDDCADILINPALAPDCGPEDIGAATMSECFACVKVDACNGGECNDDPDDCILCPGQTDEDLPDACNGTNQCPSSTACETTSDCPAGDYCSVGCCRDGGVD